MSFQYATPLEQTEAAIKVCSLKYRKRPINRTKRTAFIRTKAYGWAFVWTGSFIVPAAYQQIKNKNKKKVRQVNFLQKSQNSVQNIFQN